MFSGSGSIALEGLSRGMDEAVLIDKNPKAIQIIKKNIDALKVKNRTKVYCGDYQSILKKLDVQNKFDYVYIDPPYAMDVIEKAFSLLKETPFSGLFGPSKRYAYSKSSILMPYTKME